MQDDWFKQQEFLVSESETQFSDDSITDDIDFKLNCSHLPKVDKSTLMGLIFKDT